MATRAPFLKTRYGGYFTAMFRGRQGTPMSAWHAGRRISAPLLAAGLLFRRTARPAMRFKILGEDLVAFRDKSGAAGLLELHCPHRGTSLEFGLIGDQGIRCCYHGWLFGGDGRILERRANRATAP